ncbi:MAG: hypothetical protein LBU24_02590 [Methanocalculaceae archaeon]|jgi:hypothetical protein|nr:hypothetical protein [Methanocalculaceae archaeon]
MRSTNRDRSDHQNTARCAVSIEPPRPRGTARFRYIAGTAALLIGVLLILPASANTALYYVAEDGTSFSADITLVNQSRYLLVSPSFFSEGTALKTGNLTLTAENGTVVTATKESPMQIGFPSGNYTLTYDVPLDGYFVYAQYLSPYNTTVFLPAGFRTNNFILGPISDTGETCTPSGAKIRLQEMGNTVEIRGAAYETAVVWTKMCEIQMRFYPEDYATCFAVFVAVWLVFFGIIGLRYLRLTRETRKYL